MADNHNSRSGVDTGPERYVPTICAADTLLRPSLMHTLGQKIEARYMGDDVLESDTDLPRLSSVDLAITKHLKVLGRPDIIFADTIYRQHFIDEGEQAWSVWGPTVMARARQHSLTQTMPLESAEKLIRNTWQLGSDFSRRGWSILSTTNETPMLVMPQTSENADNNIDAFEVVDLDAFHSADPAFLKQQIWQFQIVQSLASLARSVELNIGMHEVNLIEQLPPFIQAYAQILDPVEREQARNVISAYIEIAARNPDVNIAIQGLRSELIGTAVKGAGDNATPYSLEGYVEHQANCQADTVEVAEQARLVKELYDMIKDIDSDVGADVTSPRKLNGTDRVWASPANEIIRIEDEESDIRQKHQQALEASELIRAVVSVKNIAELRAKLAQEYPVYEQALADFESWLNDSSNSFAGSIPPDNLVIFLESIPQDPNMFSRINTSDIQMDFDNRLRSLLHLAACTRPDFPGIRADKKSNFSLTHDSRYEPQQATITDPHLAIVLPLALLIAKRDEVVPQYLNTTGTGDAAYYESKLILFTQVITHTADQFRNQAQGYSESLESITQRKQTAAHLLATLGITMPDLEPLTQATVKFTKAGLYSEFASPKFSMGFTELVLEKRGLATGSPVFQHFLTELARR